MGLPKALGVVLVLWLAAVGRASVLFTDGFEAYTAGGEKPSSTIGISVKPRVMTTSTRWRRDPAIQSRVTLE